MGSERKVVTFDEVAKHRDRGDIWLLISGKVYDVTQFMDEHPGGDEILLAASGTDATEDFEDTGHSDEAKEMMKKYYIAEIDPSSIAPVKKKFRPPVAVAAVSLKDGSPGFAVKVLQLVVVLLILGLAFGFQFSGKFEHEGSYWAFIRSFMDKIF